MSTPHECPKCSGFGEYLGSITVTHPPAQSHGSATGKRDDGGVVYLGRLSRCDGCDGTGYVSKEVLASLLVKAYLV